MIDTKNRADEDVTEDKGTKPGTGDAAESDKDRG